MEILVIINGNKLVLYVSAFLQRKYPNIREKSTELETVWPGWFSSLQEPLKIHIRPFQVNFQKANKYVKESMVHVVLNFMAYERTILLPKLQSDSDSES